MSRINGDKSRFNRQRKQKIRRRKRTKELLRGSTFPKGTPGKASLKTTE